MTQVAYSHPSMSVASAMIAGTFGSGCVGSTALSGEPLVSGETEVMLWCERLMETATALEVQRNIEEITGEPCPCKQGKRCPLAPRREETVAQPV